ncbi:MAG TPA: hypothetical protein VGY91_07445 [Chthoniobacterales bacterium]|nr:hypothetical protein [Chthoniobacterales bacterium]
MITAADVSGGVDMALVLAAELAGQMIGRETRATLRSSSFHAGEHRHRSLPTTRRGCWLTQSRLFPVDDPSRQTRRITVA